MCSTSDGKGSSSTSGRISKEVEGEGEAVGWNSAVVVATDGEVVGNYRKTFLFETDKNWASEGGSNHSLPRLEPKWERSLTG